MRTGSGKLTRIGGSPVAAGIGTAPVGRFAIGGSTVRFGCDGTPAGALPGRGSAAETRGPGGGPTGGRGAIVGVEVVPAACAIAAVGGSDVSVSPGRAGFAIGGSAVWPATPSEPRAPR